MAACLTGRVTQLTGPGIGSADEITGDLDSDPGGALALPDGSFTTGT